MDDWAKVGLAGPLAEHAAGFAGWLAARGYRPSSVVIHVRLVAYGSRWMQVLGLAVSALDAALVDTVLAERRAAGYAAGLGRGSLRPLVEYLRSVGLVPAAEVDVVASATEALLSRYARYLATERGLAPGTIVRNVDLVRPFLADRERGGRVELETLSAGEVIAYVLKLSRRQPRSVARAVTALRSLLMFLHVAGVTEGGLADAIPTVARRRLAGLPKALPGEQVAAMLASCNRGS